MESSNQLFENPPIVIGSALKTVYQIFITHWKPLVTIAVFQICALIGTSILLLLIAFGFAAAYIVAIMSTISKLSQGAAAGRHLLDYSVGISGVSRLLNDYYYYDSDSDTEPDMNIFDAKFFIIFITLYIIFIAVISLVLGIFSGANYHAIADVYAGNSPSANKSISYGVNKMKTIYLYHLLLISIFTAALVVTIVLPVIFEVSKIGADGDGDGYGGPNIGLIFLGFLIFMIFTILFSSVMVAAIPSIIVEDQSALGALKRSWSLCKGSICFVFCSLYSLKAMMFTVSIFINIILDKLPAIFQLVGHLAVQLVLMPILPILGFVLYMSIRVRFERTTQDEFACEIDKDLPITSNAVEMTEGSTKNKNNKGYVNVVAEVV